MKCYTIYREFIMCHNISNWKALEISIIILDLSCVPLILLSNV